MEDANRKVDEMQEIIKNQKIQLNAAKLGKDDISRELRLKVNEI